MLIESKLKKMEQREWKIRLGDKFTISIRKQINRVFSILEAVRGIGNQAAALDPLHAGLPVAALYLILDVSIYARRHYSSFTYLVCVSLYLATRDAVKR